MSGAPRPTYPPETAFSRYPTSGTGSVPAKTSDTGYEDPRTPFAKDRDRLIYSSAFRRLAGKSQVVASTEIGPFHNRLTHSLKVAQLGRRAAEKLLERSERSTGHVVYAPDPDLVEFACLAHDIGHPPFGHNGESALQEAVDDLTPRLTLTARPLLHRERPTSIVGGFEGNPQSFRILTRLAQKSSLPADLTRQRSDPPEQWLGLHLTAASMDAVTKYPWSRQQFWKSAKQERPTGRGDHHAVREKWEAYGTANEESGDLATLEWARAVFGAEVGYGAPKSFECQLMDWCDDVTYAVHDVEDFVRVGMIPLHQLFQSPNPKDDAEWEPFRDFVQQKWTEEQKWSQENGAGETSQAYLEELREELMGKHDRLAAFDPFTGTALDFRYSHYRANELIEYFVGGITCKGEPMLHSGELQVAGSADRSQLLRDQCRLLQELIWMYVIRSSSFATVQAGQRRIIRDLIEIYCDDYHLLPLSYQQLIDSENVGYSRKSSSFERAGSYGRLRAAADYVSSLTEPHAIALHRRLTGADLGGFRELVSI